VTLESVLSALSYRPTFLRWAGADIFVCVDDSGTKQAVVVETNSSPSGCKSTPTLHDDEPQGAYRRVVGSAFASVLSELEEGVPVRFGVPIRALVAPQRAGEEEGGRGGGAEAGGRRSASGSEGGRSVSSAEGGEGAGALPASRRSPSDVDMGGAGTTISRGSSLRSARSAAAAMLVSPGAGWRSASSSSSPQQQLDAASAAALAAAASVAPRHPRGVLAVLYDKNAMEARAYASTIADATGEAVFLVEAFLQDPSPPVRWDERRMLHVRLPQPKPQPQQQRRTEEEAAAASAPSAAGEETWVPVRAAFRYVTQRPWTRLPLDARTALLNPPLACLAGGRNKAMAARAYAALNAALAAAAAASSSGGGGGGGGARGLRVRTPFTLPGVSQSEVPALVAALGGSAVVKVPYGNAGQGVYTIASPAELAAFMAEPLRYSRLVVQQLVGAHAWAPAADAAAAAAREAASSAAAGGGGSGGGVATLPAGVPSHIPRLYHAGTVPNARGETFVADLRVMVASSADGGYRPVALYARRAPDPLTPHLPANSWRVLGTNLSKAAGQLDWTTESERLLIADAKDFPSLGLGVDDLLDAFLQAVLAATAIDVLAAAMLDGRGGEALRGALDGEAPRAAAAMLARDAGAEATDEEDEEDDEEEAEACGELSAAFSWERFGAGCDDDVLLGEIMR
jgi:hypothetical protein